MFWHSIALGLTFFIVPWLQAQSPQDIQKATLAEVNPKTPEVSTEELRKILADSLAAVFDVRTLDLTPLGLATRATVNAAMGVALFEFLDRRLPREGRA